MDSYPTMILEDRYGGSYSNGKWLVISKWTQEKLDLVDNGANGDDCSAMNFWFNPPA